MVPKPAEEAIAKLLFVTRYATYILLYFLSKVTLRPKISVLAYHSVGSVRSPYSVTISDFRRQIDYLVKNYRVVSLDEISDYLEGKQRLPKKSVAITFDDGYLDNYVNAYPYLKKYRLSATIFVATAYIQKEMLLGNVYLPMLSWKEIDEMIKGDIGIGAHTASHPDLSRIDVQSAKKEILESKVEIEKKIRRKVNYFAYPFGIYDNNVVNLIRNLGFHCAFGGGGVIRKDTNIFVIPRVEVEQSTGYGMFKMKLTVALDWYKKFEQTFKRAFNGFPLISLIFEAYNTLDSQS
jgi:peptidoglycan/xylan/chitin deacetylase (PgdA/CDA1 family)